MIKVATVCSGIGSPEQALKNIGTPHEISFACEIDKYARQTYLANFSPNMMLTDMTKEDWIGEEYYSDLFIGGIPCQAFSLAGKRLGESDPRGLLFYDFYRYVKNQQPKVFVIENVKGLLSDNDGKTFRNWLQLLGQSENTHINMFNHPDSLLYNLHYTVLNSKDFEVPQNRERVFIVGIRNDLPNTFRFPVGKPLTIRLKDILEGDVNDKYYLSEKLIKGFLSKQSAFSDRFEPTDGDCIANCLTARMHKMGVTDNYIYVSKEKRTEEAKSERRNTGSNSFRSKEIVFEPQEYMNCLQTSLTNEHLIALKKSDNKDINTRNGYVTVRRLTPTECFRLQGFPDSFKKPVSETQQYKQAGNSITTFVIEAIIRKLLNIIQLPSQKAA